MSDDKDEYIDPEEVTIGWEDSDTELVRALEEHDKDAFEVSVSIDFSANEVICLNCGCQQHVPEALVLQLLRQGELPCQLCGQPLL